MTSRRFGSWLGQTKKFQEDVYGHFLGLMTDEKWAEYVAANFLAAHTELSESLAHIPWKYWRGGQKRPVGVDRDLAVRELVDVLFFVSNLLVALGVTDSELESEYERKAGINSQRQVKEVECSSSSAPTVVRHPDGTSSLTLKVQVT